MVIQNEESDSPFGLSDSSFFLRAFCNALAYETGSMRQIICFLKVDFRIVIAAFEQHFHLLLAGDAGI